MRKTVLMMSVPLLLLAGCEVKVDKDKAGNDSASVTIGADGNVAISASDGAEGLSLSVPGAEGRMKIPGLELGGDHMDIDGMKLYPGTKLSGINVTDQSGAGHGKVDMRFTSPASPDQLAAYYAAAARDAGFSDIAVKKAGSGATITATKGDGDLLTITAGAASQGSSGQILIRDSKAQ